MGTFRFTFTDITYGVDNAKAVATQVGVEIPDELKVATMPWADYKATYAKITDDDARAQFERQIKTNELWQQELICTENSALLKSIYYLYPLLALHSHIRLCLFSHIYLLKSILYTSYHSSFAYKYNKMLQKLVLKLFPPQSNQPSTSSPFIGHNNLLFNFL